MNNKLKIYACTGVGSSKQSNEYLYWTDGTNTIDNTQAVNSLLARINNLTVKAAYLQDISDFDKAQILNEIDLYNVCLLFAKKYQKDTDKLRKAGNAIAFADDKGWFNSKILDHAERKVNLDALKTKIVQISNLKNISKYSENPEFMQWWEDEIVSRNVVGLTESEREAAKEAEQNISGIGAADEAWMKDKNIGNYLLHAGTYFLYAFFTKDQLAKLPNIFKYKRNIQIQVYNYCKAYFVKTYGSSQDMDDIIHAGIVKEYGREPKEICDRIANGEAIGDFGIAEILAIVTAVLTFIGTVISAVLGYLATVKVAKYAAVSEEQANKGIPNPDDFGDYDPSTGNWNKSSNGWIALAAIGLGLAFLLKRS